MELSGNLHKMQSENNEKIFYSLILNNNLLNLNDLLNKEIKISFTGNIYCVSCGQKTYKSFAQGYCYSCFVSSPETEPCILNPELCRAHEGIARDMEWAKNHCLQTHFVYLALTNKVKVGITRATQVPTRWIDQGAWKAIKLAEVPNRYTAGIIEVVLKQHLPDKTNWQKMLKNENDEKINLLEEKIKTKNLIPSELQQFYCKDDLITELTYPVLETPVKIKSIDLEKTNEISGILTGIKGQYLIFKSGEVINIRKHSGFEVVISY